MLGGIRKRGLGQFGLGCTLQGYIQKPLGIIVGHDGSTSSEQYSSIGSSISVCTFVRNVA